ncbi:NAD(P)H-dependent oxidoreductase [Streptomyces sp. NBC_01136]|uniref:NAD(P)H-dependent oxidoreductase n=1 Tax=unclassified Streptomyces TaxID=2593676 RepID=UPI00324AFC8A|nr:NAD(P)H-dependent oxidoreductase [Streptomyces sp. NBC_01136]
MFQASRTLVLLAHPHLDRSRVNAALAAVARESPGVLVHDLYAAYPDGGIDVGREQRLLGEHDLIVLQFPFYWYSVPPFLKQWLDEVLLEGYAYGEGGDALHGKTLQVVTTTGGPAVSYGPTGYNRFSARELLLPLDATAHLIGMEYADPLLFHGVRTWTEQDLADQARRYGEFLVGSAARAVA